MQEQIKEKARARRMDTGLLRGIVRGGWVKKLIPSFLWGCGAFLLGQAEMLFGVHPLGLALLCATEQYIMPMLVGLMAAAVLQTDTPIVYVCIYAAVALVRLAIVLLGDSPDMRVPLSKGLRQRLHTDADAEHEKKPDVGKKTLLGKIVGERMALAALGGLAVGLYRAIAGGFRYYDLFAALFIVLVAPAAVAVYFWCMGARQHSPVLRNLSEAALLFSIVWAASPWRIARMPLAVMIAVFVTFFMTHRRGSVVGSVAAMVCGVAYNPLYAPSFLFGALVYAMTRGNKREGVSALLGLLAMMAWTLYVGGAEAVLQLMPAALLSAAVFTLTARLLDATQERDEELDGGDDTARLRMVGAHRQDANERLRGISDAFSSLSEMFYNLSDRFRRPGTLDLRRICDTSFDCFCPTCPNKPICWGQEYAATLNTVNELTAGLHTKGRVTRDQISTALSHRCESVDAILEKINRECAKLTGEMLRNNRTEIFAMDYESAAKIINDALEEDDGEYRFDEVLEQKISEYLTDAGIQAQSVTVYGRRRLQILVRGVEIDGAKVTVDTLRSDIEEMCGMRLASPVFEVEGGVSTMILQAGKKVSVIGAQNNVSADGGISGDSVNLFSNKKDYFYALISDGMGAGREAALTSNLCSTFLEKMLRAGNRANTSLRMLNNMMRSRGVDSTSEYSSTVDLVEIDLMNGDAAFIKSGAAPSFVVRGQVVHRLQAGTVPIGILGALDVQSTPFKLKEGDTVVMISDGILQNDPECKWIANYLCEASHLTTDEIVYRICLHAAECEEHDDCSAVALRIYAAEE